MNIKIKAIAPYIGLRDLILELANDYKDIEIDAEVGDLSEGLRIAKLAEQQDYDMIISRGGTFSLIKENVSLPVIEIPVSGYDILRVITLIKDYRGKIGIIGFSNITEGALAISKLLNLDIELFTVYHESEVESALKRAMAKGVEVVIGDVITTTVASRIGLKGILITSGQESVKEALENTYRVREILANREKRLPLYKNILDEDDRGIILTNEYLKILYINKRALSLFPQFKKGDTLNEALIKKSEIESDMFLTQLGDSKYIVKIGVNIKNNTKIYYLTDFEQIQANLSDLYKQELQTNKKELFNFGQFINTGMQMKETLNNAKLYAEQNGHIWIIGERGTGKEVLAESIHQASSYRDGPFASFSLYLYSPYNKERSLFSSEDSKGLIEICQGGTLLIKGIENASKDTLGRLLMEVEKRPNIRLIFTSQLPLMEFLEMGNVQTEFYHTIHPFFITIPPLRDRKEDIDDLIRLFTAKFNSKYGKQVVGVKDEALNILTSYQWPGNVVELEKLIERAIATAREYYIDIKDLSFLLREGNRKKEGNKNGVINIKDKTLEEIEQEIIQKVLAEENHNQSKTAKRLGINRSTLWRKIKK